MLHLAENLRKYRLEKDLTQEDVADYLNITPQSVSKWERGETYPDITLLPALANIFETSIDLLIGMDEVRSAEARLKIHAKAHDHLKRNQFDMAERVYRDALLIYPNKPGMILGLASVLALQGQTEEAIKLTEKGIPLSQNEKQKATMRATLCFLYAKIGQTDRAAKLASELPHTRESREVIYPLVASANCTDSFDDNIKAIILGEDA